MYWPGEERSAAALGDIAARSVAWPGLRTVSTEPLRLVLAGSSARFDSLLGGDVPGWITAIAVPSANTMVVRLKGDAARSLRHELAHLALHSVVQRVPRWFDEGYAAWASGEWDRLDALRVNWQLARGQPPNFTELDRDLAGGGSARAEAAYALASTAVELLARLGGDRGIEPLIDALARTPNFETAIRQTYAVTLDRFETLWHQDLRRRYGWLSFLTSATIFWGFLAVILVVLWWRRRRRDRERRLLLDEGWEIPPEEGPPTS